jgi:hypothetical protein
MDAYQTRINNYLPVLLKKIAAKFSPIGVHVHPDNNEKINDCFNNVARKVSKDGGSAVYGWAIWPGKYMIEAEKHAVWKSVDGKYMDITPRAQQPAQIAFVIDDEFEYTGQWVDNVRQNITDNSVVDDWILLCETIATLYSYGRRSGEEEIAIPKSIESKLLELEQNAKKYEPFLDAGGTPSSPCFCGSSFSYQNCHGFELKESTVEGLKQVAECMQKILLIID